MNKEQQELFDNIILNNNYNARQKRFIKLG